MVKTSINSATVQYIWLSLLPVCNAFEVLFTYNADIQNITCIARNMIFVCPLAIYSGIHGYPWASVCLH